MICFQGNSFNYNYLAALKIAVDPLHTVKSSRVGSVINLGQAYFEIAPDDPRLIFLKSRKINPVFAIVEGVWVLQGDNKLSPLEKEISDFSKFSDDGETLFGAYGYRLRESFETDQILDAINVLKKDPESRRVVLSMYSAKDITANSKDIPCNTSIFLKIIDGALDITVINRSNDLYLGVPYNVFVFGLLHRYIANEIGLHIGMQRHFTDCLHLYQCDVQSAKKILECNDFNEINLISSKFDWEYSQDILKNLEKISDCAYASIGGELGEFLVNFCSSGRKEAKKTGLPYDFKDNFWGFLAKQWLGTIS
jgi:thymidylate synthase